MSTLKVFAINRATGDDLGYITHSVPVDTGAQEKELKEITARAVFVVINFMRARGYDARTYDINLRFE